MKIYAVVENIDGGCWTDVVYDTFFIKLEKAELRLNALKKKSRNRNYKIVEIVVSE